MRLGICTGPENCALAAQAGFDYIEWNLSAMAQLPEAEFEKLAGSKDQLALPILKCNGFISGVKLTGPDVDREALAAYVDKALSRAHRLGVEICVLGSGAARAVPEGWPIQEAWRQFADFLHLAAQYAEKYQITIALEPLRRQETNLLNFVSEGVLLSAMVNEPRIQVLADTFHMLCGGEPFETLPLAGKALRHVHISLPRADLSGRDIPFPDDGTDYEKMIAPLKQMNYQGDISIEGGSIDSLATGQKAVACLKPLMQ